MTLEEAERRHIARALKAANGRIRGKGGAAERLGLHEATLRSRMKVLGIDRQPA
jgi:transcriptional regulator with GAF, ATPase, and Fis domain